MKKTLAVVVMLFGIIGYARAMDVHEVLAYQGNDIVFKTAPNKHVPPKCDPVPIPGAIWLFLSAVSGIAVVGRRK